MSLRPSKTFGENIEDILKEWENAKIFSKEKLKLGKKKPSNGNYTYKIEDTESELITKPKRGFERRTLNLTHPIPQSLLSLEISTNWPKIATWIGRKQYSIDKTEPSHAGERAISDIDFHLHSIKKDFIVSGSDWVVTTDITRFYPSIYTHSIAWAAYGKAKTKSLLYTKQHAGSLADRMDLLLRKSNLNQTIGIPIGPDTSRIVADIISSRIDDDFKSLMQSASADQGRHKRVLPIRQNQIDRLQDDWFIGTRTLDLAEQALSWISIAYRSYGLEINGAKTSVTRILNQERETWATDLSHYLRSMSGGMSGTTLKGFLDQVIHLQTIHKSSPVVSFAISALESIDVSEADAPMVESFLILGASIAPSHMDRICTALLNLEYATKTVSKNRIRERFVPLAEQHMELGNSFETIWLLYALRGLRIKFISKKLADLCEIYQGATIPLVLLDMDQMQVFNSKLNKEAWEKGITKDTIRHDWTWLLGYEAFRHGWLTDKRNLMQEDFFRPLTQRNIVFYDEARNVKKSSALFKTRMAKGRKSSTLSKALLAQLTSTRLRLRAFLNDEAY